MKNFALLGGAGYVAPRHMSAIKKNGGNLSVFYDISESVGVIDSFFKKALFFNNFETFTDAVYALKDHPTDKIDFFSVCTPNHMHYYHIVAGLRMGCDVICEKPLVNSIQELGKLSDIEMTSGQRVFGVLQLRYHPAVMALKDKVSKAPKDKKFDVLVTYITGRGDWYFKSWKGNPKTGFGVVANIGIHFFDLLMFIFGDAVSNVVHRRDAVRASGFLELQNARVSWFLSVDSNDIPSRDGESQDVFRHISVSGEQIDLSENFHNLHQTVYEDILAGNGIRLSDVLPSIELVQEIREAPLASSPFGDFHPLNFGSNE